MNPLKLPDLCFDRGKSSTWDDRDNSIVNALESTSRGLIPFTNGQ